jgi:hypothetical protein
MTGRPAAERREHTALVAAQRKAEARYWESPAGMRATAAELRRTAIEMTDRNDCNAMLRLAASYERRADDALWRRLHHGH